MWGKTDFCESSNFFLFFRLRVKTLWLLGGKNLVLWSFRVQWNFLQKKIDMFSEKKRFFCHFQAWSEFFLTSWLEMRRQRCANWLLNVLKKFLWKEYTSKHANFSDHLRTWSKVFGPSAKKFRQGCQNWFPLVKWNNLRSFLKIKVVLFHRFRNLWRSFLENLAKKIWHGSQDCILCVRMNILWEKRSFESFKFFKQFRFLAKIFQPFSKKYIRSVVDTAFSVFRRTFWGSFFFKSLYFPIIVDNWTKFLSFQEKKHRQAYRSPFLRAQKNTERESSFFVIISFFFYLFRTAGEFFLAFWGKNSALRLKKTASSVSSGTFWGKLLSKICFTLQF